MKISLQISLVITSFLLFNSNVLADNDFDKIQAIIEIQSGDVDAKVPFSINLDGSNSKGKNLSYSWEFPDKVSTEKNPRPYKFNTPGHYTITLTVSDGKNSNLASLEIIALPQEENGDLSNKITISEIMPNPKGKDQGQEWIELYNQDQKTINLGNWKLNNHPISDKINIKSGSYLILEAEHLPFSLKNNNSEVTLKNYLDQTIDEIHYSKTYEGKSYSKIQIGETEKLNWTEPTKNKQNQKYKVIEGRIIKGGKYKIRVPETENSNLIKTIFQNESRVKILVEERNSSLIMEKYKVENPKSPKKAEKKHQEIYLLLIFAILIASLGRHYNKF